MWDNKWTLGLVALVALLGVSAAAFGGFGMMAARGGTMQHRAGPGNPDWNASNLNWAGTGNHTWSGNFTGPDNRTWAGNVNGTSMRMRFGNNTFNATGMAGNFSGHMHFANGTLNATGTRFGGRQFNSSDFNATNMSVPAAQRLAFSQALYEGDYAGAQTLAGQYPALNRTLSHMNPSTFDSQAQFYRDMQSHDFSAALADIQQMRNSTHSAPMTGSRGMGRSFGPY